jgi:N-acetylglucosaminyldiphosphoundecaprenol N-acetyl-beta-D-mannosaminyltransferase
LTFISKPVTILGTMSECFETVELCGMSLASVHTQQLIDHVFESLGAGRGGWLVTANLDFLRRYVRDPGARDVYAGADLRVADGMPLVWASHLRGTPLPERVAGSSLLVPLCQRAAREGHSVYLLGGDPGVAEVAAERLRAAAPGLQIAGLMAPRISAEVSEADVAEARAALSATRPALVFVAFGSPKQELVIARLRQLLPGAWWMGVGISFSFLAGHVARAPVLLQNLGLEWAFRLAQEPERLLRRYVVENIPFAFELFGRAALDRLRDGGRRAP